MIVPTHVSITLMSGPRDGEMLRFVVHGEGTAITLGRREDCDICLSYDSQVSRLHAQITFEGGRFWLEDLDSRNGTHLNGETIQTKAELLPNSTFRVGRTWLRFNSLPSDETQTSRPVIDPTLNDDSDSF